MPRVFITSEIPTLDYSPALRWGKPVGVFSEGQVHLFPQDALALAVEKLAGFTSDDYLALVGDPVKIALCYNRFTHEYVEVVVDFSSLFNRQKGAPSDAHPKTSKERNKEQ
jgi:hypothetical protein